MPLRSLALFGCLLAAGSALGQPLGTGFRDAVTAKYDGWVKAAPGGTLTPARVAALVNSDKLTGDEAAAVAAVHRYFRDNPGATATSKAWLLDAAARPGGYGRRDQPSTLPLLEEQFRLGREHLQAVPRKLFVADAPRRAGIEQGTLGDCYLLAAVGAAVSARPAAVRELFRPLPGGGYEVTFPGAGKVTVPPPTDARLALGSSAGAQGLWLNVLEEAFARLPADRKKADAVCLDAISRGGDPGAAIVALTGHKVSYYWTRPPKGKGAAKPDEIKTAADLRPLLKAAQADRRLVCVGTAKSAAAAPGVVSCHAHAVLGFDAATDRVRVWNPWGNSFDPESMSGLAGGFTVADGEFSLTVPEFVRVFECVSVETDRPLGKK